MILDSKWIFADGESMPNATTGVPSGAGDFDGYIDWTSSKVKDWINSSVPIWIICTCNTVPGTGTSFNILFYQHSTTSLASGDLLLATRDIAIADLSADPLDPGHWICCVPLISILSSVQAADRDQYFGPVMNGTGNVSSGKVDIYLWIGVNPPIPVARPVSVGGSNVVMPT
jgi:hypothetical protein